MHRWMEGKKEGQTDLDEGRGGRKEESLVFLLLIFLIFFEVTRECFIDTSI